MTVPVRRLRAAPAVTDDELEDDFAPAEFYSGERICAPSDGRGRIGVLRGIFMMLLALGGGWALISYQDVWRGWVASGFSAVSSAIDQRGPAPVVAAAAAVPAPLPPPAPVAEPVMPPHAVAVDPAPAQPEAQGDVETASVEPPTEAAAPQPLPPPVVDPADPYQKRAVAVGLHPKLSRVLLTKLSATDYRNAQTAIEMAVAKTPDTGTFVWPRQRTPELALFEVHFVPGAAPHCRRYVVIVTKDRWSTTALPMEKCGVNRTAGKSK